MKKYDSIIFDLDGTLWDSTQAIADGWNTALAGADLSDCRVTADDIRGVCGLPFDECVTTLFGHQNHVDCRVLETLLDKEEKLSLEVSGGTVFNGVAEGLEKLSREYSLYIVSNCQSWYLKLFLEKYSLECLFQGQDCYGDSGVPKSEMIGNVVNRFDLHSPIYIGDTAGDQESSLNAGVDFGHAAYGFGTVESAQATFDDFEQLVQYFI